MLIARPYPRDRIEVDAVVVLQDRARPQTGRYCVATIDADLFSFQVLWSRDAGLRVVHDSAMMEGSDQEYRKCGKSLPVNTGCDVGGQRQLADVEFQFAHHTAEGA